MKASKDKACLPTRLYNDKIYIVTRFAEKVEGWIISETFKNDKMALVILDGQNV